jgi:two-component system sensor histidine kinase/response regulator
MDIVNFLKKNINNTENTKDLINLFLTRGDYKFGSLFYQKTNTSYQLVDHVHIDKTIDIEKNCISFTPYVPITDTIIFNIPEHIVDYKSPHEISNIIIIPICVHTDIIGVICLGNKDEDINKQDIELYIDVISLTQLIINKFKLIEKYKKVYSDATYFSKDLFLANMSHEIRTPLNGIIGYNQLLIKTSLSKIQKTYINSISECSIQLMTIINDIIDFSKLSSGKMKTYNECFYITDVMEIIEHTMEQRLRNKKHKLRVFIDPDVPKFIIMDKQKLIQIIINLLSNAINYSEISTVIEIYIHNKENTLKIEVIDKGIGISESDRCKLFNSFVQINNSITKNGTGLGLAISKRLVELLNGEIDVKSTPGIGSNFYFTCKHFPIQLYEKLIMKESSILKNKWVIVVDDNPDNRIQLSDILFELEMNPIICGSGKEAIRLLHSNRYDFELGLIDICMPEIDGVQLAAQIKLDRPLFPLVALSSVSGFIDTSNFEYKLDKPINKLQIFNVIHNIITNKTHNHTCMKKDITVHQNTSKNSPKDFSRDIKILIAEDVLYNRELIKDMINSIGYNNMTIVDDGIEAINMITKAKDEQKQYKVLLVDLRMPKADGYDVIEFINKNIIEKPIIIVVTASILDSDRNKCKELGVDFFIDKPINLVELKNTLLCVSKNKF